MKLRSAQALLFVMLLAALALALCSLWLGYSRRQFFADDLQGLVLQSLAQFSGPLSIVIGSYFALRREPRTARVPGAGLILAVLCTFAWCAVTSGRTVAFIASPDEAIPALTAWNSQVATAASFLVNGVLAYFFASAPKPQP